MKQVNMKVANVKREMKSDRIERNLLINKVKECTRERSERKHEWEEHKDSCIGSSKEDEVKKIKDECNEKTMAHSRNFRQGQENYRTIKIIESKRRRCNVIIRDLEVLEDENMLDEWKKEKYIDGWRRSSISK